MKINTIHDKVKMMLVMHPDCRNSDSLLYACICEDILPEVAFLPFLRVMKNPKQYGLPGFETVRRARQKIQHNHPELAADEHVEVERMIREEEFEAYARKIED